MLKKITTYERQGWKLKQINKNAEASRKTSDCTITRLAQPEYKMGVCTGCFPANTGPAPPGSGRLPLCIPITGGSREKGADLCTPPGGPSDRGKVLPGNHELSRGAAAPGLAPVLARPQGGPPGGLTSDCPPWPSLRWYLCSRLLPAQPGDPCLPHPNSILSSL